MADSTGLKMQEESDLIVERFRSTQYTPSRFAPTTFLLDYTTRKYIYVDESCFYLAGFAPSHYYESGLDGYLKNWHPDDYRIVNEKIFPDNMHFLSTLPKEKYPDIVITYNYRMLNAAGEYITILQRFSYIPSEIDALPLGVVGVAMNISHFKSDHSIVHTIEDPVQYNEGIVSSILFKKIHPVVDNNDLLLSSREKEILRYIAEGHSSKQIADRLGLSVNTISNHRKTMLAKTHCSSSAELMNYAVRHALL